MKTAHSMTTDAIRTEIRALESPENYLAAAGYTELDQQMRLDRLCEELGRRGED